MDATEKLAVKEEGIEEVENGIIRDQAADVSENLGYDIKRENSPEAEQDGIPGISALNIKIVDQMDLEQKVANDADKAIFDQELEIENKRLAKANDRYVKYMGQLSNLRKKLERPNLKISEKTRIGVQIEELEENEIMKSLKDVNEIKSRIRDLKIKMDPARRIASTEYGSASDQLPDETKEEYLIRTGKVTAFGTTSAFISENDNAQAPTHKNLIMPGFESVEETGKSKEVPEVYNLDSGEDDASIDFTDDHHDIIRPTTEDQDFKIDYDEINSDNVTDDSDDIDGLYKDTDGIDVSKPARKRKTKAKIKGDQVDDLQTVDDGDESSYQRRLKKWVEQRSSLRKQHNSDYVDDLSVDEWFKPHPTVKDAVLNDKFKLPGDIFPSLFDYQKTCVQWLSELHSQRTGGIIGDEMGLGKTVQMISFLAGLHYSQNLKGPILVVCPATVLKQWCNEFHRWWPPFRAVILHSIGEGMSTQKKRRRKGSDDEFEDELDDEDLENEEFGSVKTLSKTRENKNVKELVNNVVSKGHVIITTYAGVRMYAQYLLPVKWGYAILDEGHKIRNPDSYITITCKQLKTPNRIILSGTPIQNNLVELWSLFDFIFPGRLGTLPVFQKQFCIPINLGGYANATNVQVQAGYKCAVILKDLVSPYLLRRVKADVAKDLPKKTEMVLFCKLTPEQRTLYQKFIDSPDLQKILAGKRNALFGIDMLRKICNHPNLVDMNVKGKKIVELPKLDDLVSKSGKLQVVIALLELWTNEKRKILIFTQTKQMLNILQQLVDILNKEQNKGYKYMRMDGGTPIIERQSLVDEFNTDPSYNIFLLTTRVGGLGVNLTGASRVIIYDPDWNPSTDMQARERAWRLGQKKDVAIYRLIMAGSIEEKIYHRQIFKQFLTNKILKDPKQKRFFKMTDMYDLFSLGDDEVKGTETADLFDADESTFDGIKERKSKFKSRPSNRLLKNGKPDEADEDFLKATKISGVAGLAEYNDEDVKEKSMFDDDDSRVVKSKDAQISTNLMSDIFKKTGIHSAVEHDSIMDKSNLSSASDTSAMLVDNEATRIANEAVAALRESRKLTKTNGISVPTWTGKFGRAGRTDVVKRQRTNSPLPTSPIGRNGSRSPIGVSGVAASSTILAGIQKRKEGIVKKPTTKSESLIRQLSDYMSRVNGNFSTSSEVLDHLDIDFSDKQTVNVVRNMLKNICTWDKERKGWVLNAEFQ